LSKRTAARRSTCSPWRMFPDFDRPIRKAGRDLTHDGRTGPAAGRERDPFSGVRFRREPGSPENPLGENRT